VYGAGDIDIKEMVVEGALLSLIVSCIIAVITYAMLH
jgi:sodium-dependent dicarboxylate transporter 2/3/5